MKGFLTILILALQTTVAHQRLAPSGLTRQWPAWEGPNPQPSARAQTPSPLSFTSTHRFNLGPPAALQAAFSLAPCRNPLAVKDSAQPHLMEGWLTPTEEDGLTLEHLSSTGAARALYRTSRTQFTIVQRGDARPRSAGERAHGGGGAPEASFSMEMRAILIRETI